MKFLAQYKCSICGTLLTETVDVFVNILNNNLFLFKRRSNKSFDFVIIEKNNYNYKEFENLLLNPQNINKDCNLLHIWRADYCLKPLLLNEEYYLHIVELYEYMETQYKNPEKT